MNGILTSGSIYWDAFGHTRRWLAGVVYTMVCIIMIGCQPSQSGRVVSPVPIHPLRVPEGNYRALAWTSTDRVIFEYRPKGKQGPGTNLWIMRSDGTELHELTLPPDTQNECSWTEYHDPVVLSNGQVAYVRSCHTAKEPFWSSSVLVLNPNTQTSQLLFNQEIPEAALFSIAFGSDLSYAVGATYSDVEHYMFGIDSGGTYTLELGRPRPNRPAWSRDGKTIAFFGNQSMQSEPGPNWAAQAYDLWLIPADCVTRSSNCTDKARMLLESVDSPTNMAWSPDGKWLAFDGDVQGQGKGIWLLNVNGQKLYQVAVGNFERPAWSPDGHTIMVVVGSPLQGQSNSALVSYASLAILNVNKIVNDSGATP